MLTSHFSVAPFNEPPGGHITDASHLPDIELYVYPLGHVAAATCSQRFVSALYAPLLQTGVVSQTALSALYV
jgi:hypothetical protein